MNSLTRHFLRTSIHHPLTAGRPAKQIQCVYRSRFHSSTLQPNEQTVHLPAQPVDSSMPSSPKLVSPSTSGKKFKDLAHDLNQKSLYLVEQEAIQLPANYTTERRAGENEQSKAIVTTNSNEEMADTKSRRKRRTDFSPDPEFQFQRKRGKRHIMNQLKQAKLNGGSAQSHKIELVDHLDLSIRWHGRLNKILISLPALPAQPTNSNPTTSTTSSDSPIEHQPTMTKGEQLNGLDEFIKLCLGPLVWSNPKVDISLVYKSDQSKPTITFGTTEGATDGSIENQTSQQVDLEGKSRSEILRLVLNLQK